MSERKVGSVTYQEVGEDYFKQRGLRRHAGVFALWSLGVAAVISGDFFGWNFGLAYGHGVMGNLRRRPLLALFVPALLASLVRQARALFPGFPVVGYERDGDLEVARSIGFEPIGQLRVWIRRMGDGGDAPHAA